MDRNSSPPRAATGSTTSLIQQPLPLTASPPRVTASRSERLLRDVRILRPPPKPRKDRERPKVGRAAPSLGLGAAKLWASKNPQPKPLVPVTERKSHEETLAGRRARKGSQDEGKWELTPDGGSAGREGRQFAVANVGNNGRIYLR
jgi:hypothetical protein